MSDFMLDVGTKLPTLIQTTAQKRHLLYMLARNVCTARGNDLCHLRLQSFDESWVAYKVKARFMSASQPKHVSDTHNVQLNRHAVVSRPATSTCNNWSRTRSRFCMSFQRSIMKGYFLLASCSPVSSRCCNALSAKNFAQERTTLHARINLRGLYAQAISANRSRRADCALAWSKFSFNASRSAFGKLL